MYENLNLDIGSVRGYENIKNFLIENKSIFMDKNKFISFDIETKNLSMRNNKLLGFGIGFSKTKSRYIITRDLTLEELKKIFKVFNTFKCKIILHNSYFDISQLNYMLGFSIRWNICTYILAHCLHSDILLYSETKDKANSLSLKELCKTYYSELYGYENELEKVKKKICKENKILKKDFTYDLFSDNDLIPYGNYDVLVTYALFESFIDEIKENKRNGWDRLDYLIKLKHKVTDIYIKAKINGIKVNRDKILELNSRWNDILQNNLNEILQDENVRKTESLLYMKEYEKLISKREKEYKNKLQDRLDKINKGKYKKENLIKAKNNITKLTQKMLDNIQQKSKFNLKSPQHKATLFVEIMGLEPLKYNDINSITGVRTPKTDKEFLEKYSHIPLVNKIKEYSLYVKGVDGFLGVNDVNCEKGLWHLTEEEYPINHPNSNLQGTITHRVAQNSINLQQLPSRGSLSELKECIIPLKDNHRIIALDYSSCELYILGALSQEPNLINAIKNGLDLHSNMAYEVWADTTIINEELENDIKNMIGLQNIAYNEREHTLATLDMPKEKKLLIIKNLMDNTLRYNAKAINFGTPYGIGAKGLADNIKKTVKEAEKMLEEYMSKNNKIKEYMDKNKDLLCKNGYIEGEHGQRIYMTNSKGINWRKLKDVKYEDKKYVLEELRKSTNYIIQSENAMILYEALIRLDGKLKQLKLDNKVFLMTTIYDACYLSVDNSVSNDEIKDILKEVFEINYTEDVKFKIDIQCGKNFKELENL